MPADAAPALLYLPGLPEPGTRVELTPADSRYIARVCRARAGERVEATDGRGARAALRLVEVRGVVVVQVESVWRDMARRRAWVLCGAPEGERGDWLVEKLAELGIERFLPVDSARGRWRWGEGRRVRWERLAVAALRQSRRSLLLTVSAPVPLEQALSDLPGEGCRWLAEASGETPGHDLTAGRETATGLIGPSGGFEAGEREAAVRAGFRALRLSDARLRTETAALAWAVWWSGGGG